jgi:crotonobetainyl-CoA:carnitine CoA-transferase CaiB-like acyl-CoA transferase
LSTPPSARALELLAGVGLEPGGPVALEGRDPVLASRFPVGEAAAAALTACGAASARLFEERGGPPQRVVADVRAAAASLLSFAIQRLDGAELPRPAATNPTVGLYRAGDGRWIHLHGGFPHLEAGTLELLDCEREASALARAVEKWSARELEEALARARLCGAVARTSAEWAAHPQGRALAALGLVEVERIGDADPEPLGPAERPLAGIRVLDLTRVLAGPACARTLAEHGAGVLRIDSPRRPSIAPYTVDTGHGKRAAWLDLERPAHAARLRELVRGADVFSQGYRPGALERRGLGARELAALRPGLVYVSVSCYGDVGPWRERSGWEQLAQTATGLACEQGSPAQPALIPAAACDYTTGYLGALGALAALRRRTREGGSWHVRVSLCRTATWIGRMGAACDPARASGLGDLDELCQRTRALGGVLTHLRPVARLSGTPARWERPPVPLGTHRPVWSD